MSATLVLHHVIPGGVRCTQHNLVDNSGLTQHMCTKCRGLCTAHYFGGSTADTASPSVSQQFYDGKVHQPSCMHQGAHAWHAELMAVCRHCGVWCTIPAALVQLPGSYMHQAPLGSVVGLMHVPCEVCQAVSIRHCWVWCSPTISTQLAASRCLLYCAKLDVPCVLHLDTLVRASTVPF